MTKQMQQGRNCCFEKIETRTGIVGFLRFTATALAAAGCLAMVTRTALANWTVTPRGSVSLTANGLTGLQQLSGVTYLGPAEGGLQRFAAVQDSLKPLVVFDVSLAADGTLSSASAVSTLVLAPGADYEGIVYTGPERNTVFVSEETTANVHEHSLATGLRLQTAAISSVFKSHRQNIGLEALARSISGEILWTANEEALPIDGPLSTQSTGTVVRLQQIRDNGNGTTTGGPQYAYLTRPIHTGGIGIASGLSDLVMLPDDTLLALERSAIAGSPRFRTSIDQIDFGSATDISAAQFNTGLVGKTYTPVAKEQLWSGQIGGTDGQGASVEGLALGPVLSDGHWLLLGVADNNGLGPNYIVSFDLALGGTGPPGDYNRDGSVDRSDYVLWKNTYASATVLSADGNGNQIVDAADYTIWRNNFGTNIGSGTVSNLGHSLSVPEPATAAILTIAMFAFVAMRFAFGR